MATWEDGPEYAPVQRPAEYAEPAVAPLASVALEPPLSAGAPVEVPRFDDPAEPVAALATLVPERSEPQRDPHEPFEVVTVALTPDPTLPLGGPPAGSPTGYPPSAGAWGAAHWSPPTAGGPAVPGPWGPPAGTPWPAPVQPSSQPFPVATAGPPTSFPAPGTAQWFGPGPATTPPPSPTVDARAILQAATPGLLITLAIGLSLYLAPFTLCLGFFLSSRIQVARRAIQRGYLGLLALFGLAAMFAAATNLGTFSDWWSTVSRWALLLSVTAGVMVWVLVRRGLLARGRPS